LASIIIPDSVKNIGEHVFSNCRNLTSIVVEKGNTVYDSRNNCNAIIKTATNTLHFGCQTTNIPDSVTSIGDHAFYSCYGLTSVTIPDSVTSIGTYAFSYCYGLTSITIPDSVTIINGYAFSECPNLTSLTIGNNVLRIEENAFRNCSGLTSVTIPNSVTSIGNYAFCDCKALILITIGSGVESIGSGVITNCFNLTTITCKAITPPYVVAGTFNDVNKSITVYVPAESIAAYKAADGWKDFTNIQAI
jgi:hypothetical protein